MSFQFIDNGASIDRVTRKRIRSHVALGRNAGRKLNRPSRKAQRAQPIQLPFESRTVSDQNDKSGDESRLSLSLVIERQVDDGLYFTFEGHISAKSRGLIRKAYTFINAPRHTPELSTVLDTRESFSNFWVRSMFHDEAYFHCSIAVFVTAFNNLTQKQENAIEIMQHLSKTFQLVNEKLSRDDWISDTTLAVVVVMAQIGPLQGKFRESVIHLEALHRMVIMRGGISQLIESSPGLAIKVLRLDLSYALNLGTQTKYRTEDVATSSTALFGRHISIKRQHSRSVLEDSKFELIDSSHTKLHLLLIDMLDLTRLLNDASSGRGFKLSADLFHHSLLQFGYRLVNICPLGGPHLTSRLGNAIHLGLVMFIVSFLRGLDYRIMDVPFLPDLVRSTTEEPFPDEPKYQETLLWMLSLAMTSISRERLDKEWLIAKILVSMHNLRLSSWGDASRILAQFPWVNALHDKAYEWYKSPSNKYLAMTAP